MGKSYGEDLRLKALAALDSGMNKMSVHRAFGVSRCAFGVSRSTLDDWIALRQAQGHVRPSRSLVRTGQGFFDAVRFEEFARRHQEETLGQMRVAWESEKGQCLSERTFSNWVRRLGWTRKKRVGFTPSETKTSVLSS
jgi:transposase